MTPPSPAEVAALRERLVERWSWLHPDGEAAADIRAALALLDAQAAEIARLTAERDAFDQNARDAIAEHERMSAYVSKLEAERERVRAAMRDERADAALVGEADNCLARIDRALAPAPAAEVAG